MGPEVLGALRRMRTKMGQRPQNWPSLPDAWRDASTHALLAHLTQLTKGECVVAGSWAMHKLLCVQDARFGQHDAYTKWSPGDIDIFCNGDAVAKRWKSAQPLRFVVVVSRCVRLA